MGCAVIADGELLWSDEHSENDPRPTAHDTCTVPSISNGADSGAAITREASRSRRPASRLRAPKSVEKLKKEASSSSHGVLKDANVVPEEEQPQGKMKQQKQVAGQQNQKRKKRQTKRKATDVSEGKGPGESASPQLGLVDASSAFVEDVLRTGKAILSKKAGTKRFNFPTTRQLESNAELRKAYIMEMRAELRSQLGRVEKFGVKCREIENSFTRRFGDTDSKLRKDRAELAKARQGAIEAEEELASVVAELEETSKAIAGARCVWCSPRYFLLLLSFTLRAT